MRKDKIAIKRGKVLDVCWYECSDGKESFSVAVNQGIPVSAEYESFGSLHDIKGKHKITVMDTPSFENDAKSCISQIFKINFAEFKFLYHDLATRKDSGFFQFTHSLVKENMDETRKRLSDLERLLEAK